MGVPISQMWTVASYVLTQKLKRRKQYPLVLMLEPLFRCNLACAGCGKIQYPAHILKQDMPLEAAAAVAERSRGTPRIANRLLRRVRDFAQMRAGGKMSLEAAVQTMELLEVDANGFDVMDRKVLNALIEQYGGGPAGLDAIAASIGESRDTIEDVIEPYLLQQGYLQRTPRGRVASPKAYQVLGLPAPKRGSDLFEA